MNRRQFITGLSAIGVSSVGFAAWPYWPDSGLHHPCHQDIPASLTEHPLYAQIWRDIAIDQVWDSHVHVVGIGDSDSGVWFNPNMDSLLHPILKLQKHFYMNGLCADPARVDLSALERLHWLHQRMPSGYKSLLFAFDWFHTADGTPDSNQSIFYIPNSYAAKIAKQYPQHFEWVASIHPYRKDAIEQLHQAKAEGARAIKWLPSGMGIDPSNPKCDRYYQTLAELNLPLISHTGAESAVQGGDQRHGNPLHLRRALDQGAIVVLAHCASDGQDDDLDHHGKRVPSFSLFTRLMDTPEYQSRLFGEISALTLVNHAHVIPQLLARQDWHARLINGSDYPLPAIMPLTNLRQLVHRDHLSHEQATFLLELKQYHPLLYDFGLKRLVSHQGKTFQPIVFASRRVFDSQSSNNERRES